MRSGSSAWVMATRESMVGVSEATDSVEGMIIEAGDLSSDDDDDDDDGTFGRGTFGGGVGGVN